MVVLVISFFIIGASAYYKYIILEDFLLYAYVDCNPVTENCFIINCYEFEGRCNPGEEFYFYKIIYKKAKNAPVCNFDECPHLDCQLGEEECEVVFCSLKNPGIDCDYNYVN